ncbi:hypothetical protein HF086_001452 [Spodoptera exigua]|uniref:Uncharacterized protein n=1 Tax=Spodoptera exigua TaxID=7107 RepID=A0A922MFP6_SPOEX|nr:hypothetical protein HF086_001452 [Spodoptera exigua]
MLFYSAFCGCFLTILALDNKKVKIPESGKIDAIFADVIKNISRVNNVLQDLINNYEQSQKTYKSQENIDGSDYTSGADVDNISQNDKKSLRTAKKVFHTTPKSYTAGTKMILSDIELDKNPVGITDKTIGKRLQPSPEKLPGKKLKPVVLRTTRAAKQLKISRAIKKTFTTTTARNTATKKQASKQAKRLGLKHSKEDKATVTKDTVIISADTHTRAKNKTDNRKPKGLPKPISDKKLKSRPVVKYTENKNIYITDLQLQYLRDRNDFKQPLNTLHSQSVETQKKLYIQKTQLHKNLRNQGNSKDENTNTGNIEKQKNNKQRNQKSSRHSVKTEKSRNPKKITTTEDPCDSDTQKRYAIPRHLNNYNNSDYAYNSENERDLDHLQALKTEQERKESARHFQNQRDTINSETQQEAGYEVDKKFSKQLGEQKYPDSLEETDLSKASEEGDALLDHDNADIERAVSQTDVSPLRSQAGSKSIQSSLDNKVQISDDDDTLLKDVFKTSVLRQAYGDACLKLVVRKCYRPMLRRSLISDKDTIKANNSKGNDLEINILRDRYEKACQKISRQKCNAACTYAQDTMCAKYECTKTLKKNLKRNCKFQCKIAYSSSSKTKSSGSNSDDSGSDDSSEDKSSESDSDDD